MYQLQLQLYSNTDSQFLHSVRWARMQIQMQMLFRWPCSRKIQIGKNRSNEEDLQQQQEEEKAVVDDEFCSDADFAEFDHRMRGIW